jgi:hypothetical protein
MIQDDCPIRDIQAALCQGTRLGHPDRALPPVVLSAAPRLMIPVDTKDGPLRDVVSRLFIKSLHADDVVAICEGSTLTGLGLGE